MAALISVRLRQPSQFSGFANGLRFLSRDLSEKHFPQAVNKLHAHTQTAHAQAHTRTANTHTHTHTAKTPTAHTHAPAARHVLLLTLPASRGMCRF